jgi:hypothetical protein
MTAASSGTHRRGQRELGPPPCDLRGLLTGAVGGPAVRSSSSLCYTRARENRGRTPTQWRQSRPPPSLKCRATPSQGGVTISPSETTNDPRLQGLPRSAHPRSAAEPCTQMPAVYRVLRGKATRNAYLQAFRQSPLTDSNRRPPPYHALPAATGRNQRQRFWLVLGASGSRRFATGCHRLQPRGSIKAPSLVVREGDSGPA